MSTPKMSIPTTTLTTDTDIGPATPSPSSPPPPPTSPVVGNAPSSSPNGRGFFDAPKFEQSISEILARVDHGFGTSERTPRKDDGKK